MQTPASIGIYTPSPAKDHRVFGEGVEPRGPGRLLVIANDRAMQSVLATLTTIEGCEATASVHGLAAQRAIRTWRPGVILVDLDDVLDDAQETVRFYREVAGDDVTVVAFTSADPDEKWSAELGAAAILTKPFAATELLELLNRLANCTS